MFLIPGAFLALFSLAAFFMVVASAFSAVMIWIDRDRWTDHAYTSFLTVLGLASAVVGKILLRFLTTREVGPPITWTDGVWGLTIGLGVSVVVWFVTTTATRRERELAIASHRESPPA